MRSSPGEVRRVHRHFKSPFHFLAQKNFKRRVQRADATRRTSMPDCVSKSERLKKRIQLNYAQRKLSAAGCIIEAPVCDGSVAASVTTDPEVTTTQLLTCAPLPTTAPSPISTCDPTATAEMLTLLPTCTKDPKVRAACDEEPSDLTTEAGCTTDAAPITQ